MTAITQCGACKAPDSVSIETFRQVTGQLLRRAICHACGRIGAWKSPSTYSGIANEAHALIYAPLSRGVER